VFGRRTSSNEPGLIEASSSHDQRIAFVFHAPETEQVEELQREKSRDSSIYSQYVRVLRILGHAG
jgi:hypothetical protein